MITLPTHLSWRPPPGAYGFSLTETPCPPGWPYRSLAVAVVIPGDASPLETGGQAPAPGLEPAPGRPSPRPPLCSHARSCGPDALSWRTPCTPQRPILWMERPCILLPTLASLASVSPRSRVPSTGPAVSTLVPPSSPSARLPAASPLRAAPSGPRGPCPVERCGSDGP